MNWTTERVDRLTALWRDGLTASQIASELGGITRNAVIGKAHRLGLSGRPSPIKKGASSPRKPRRPAEPAPAQRKRRPATQQRRPEIAPPAGNVTSLPPRRLPNTGDAARLFGPGIEMMALTERTCRWPVGDPRGDDFRFCGHAVEPGVSYCAHHAAVAYHRPQARRDDPSVTRLDPAAARTPAPAVQAPATTRPDEREIAFA